MRLLFLLFLCNAGNCRPRNFEYRFIGTPDKETRVPHGGYRSDYSSGSDDTVASLQLGDRLLQFSLPLLLRPDEQHVEDANDQEHRDQPAESPQAALKYH